MAAQVTATDLSGAAVPLSSAAAASAAASLDAIARQVSGVSLVGDDVDVGDPANRGTPQERAALQSQVVTALTTVMTALSRDLVVGEPPVSLCGRTIQALVAKISAASSALPPGSGCPPIAPGVEGASFAVEPQSLLDGIEGEVTVRCPRREKEKL